MKPMNTVLRRTLLAFTALGLAFAGALLVMGGLAAGWGLIALGLPLAGVLALAGDALGPQFAPTLRGRSRALLAQTRPWTLLLALYVLFKIPVPLWPEGFAPLALLSTGALFAAALAYAWERVGPGRALGIMALAFSVGLGIELLGSRTGVPFGLYSYATAPAPTLLGVPLIVPLGWFAMTLAATLLSGARPWLAGVLLVAWDVGLEPLMTAQRYWLWNDPAPLWAGAPLQNFLSWWAVGTFISWAMLRVAPELRQPQAGRPSAPGPSFGLAYPIEAFFLPGGLLLVGRPAEAAATLAAMLGALALSRWRQAGARAEASHA